MSIAKMLLYSIAISGLSACATLPQPVKPPEFQSVNGLDQTLDATPPSTAIMTKWPQANWWQALHNTQLQDLIETGLRDSPNLQAATARVAQAEAAADFQAAELLPTLSANIELHNRRYSGTDFYGPNGGKTFHGAYIDPAVFKYHLDLWGKDRAALEAALGKERAQGAELAMTRLMLSTAITREYIRLCAVTEDMELSRSLRETAARQVQLDQLRWQEGLSSREHLYPSEQVLAAAQQRETDAAHHSQILRNRLAALAGRQPDWGAQIQIAPLTILTYLPPPQSLSLGLLAHRPDVAASLWRAKAAAQMIKIAETNFYPDVNLVGFAGLRSLNFKDLFLSNGTSLAYGIGPTLSLPLFEGGRLEAELSNEQAGYRTAVASYNQTLLEAVQQVADSLAGWRQTAADINAQTQAVAAAQAAAGLAASRYRAGLSNLDAELEATAALLRQQLTASALLSAHQQASIALIAALGGGYQAENITMSEPDNHE